MSDKRRRNRVQGGWGGVPSNKKPEEKRDKSRHLGHEPTLPPNDTFVYRPTLEIKDRPDDLIYQESGCYCLSTSQNGASNIELCYGFIAAEECEWIFEHLKQNIPWKQESIYIRGEEKSQPRLTAWYGDISYSYSGLTLTPYQFSPILVMLREQIEKKTGLLFNSMLANLYRHEKDSVDWHSDDERSLGDNPVIASLSFGDLRNFELRQIPSEGDRRDFSLSQHVKMPLSTGCLLIMQGATQKDWQHRVPKEYHDHGERINLTFRQINVT